MTAPPTIAIFGASGLIGEATARQLQAEGFRVLALARRFSPAQRAAFPNAVEAPLLAFSAGDLDQILSAHGAEIVVNCIGVLQSSPQKGSAEDVHCGFAARLVEATQARLLVQISIPGSETEDRTPFSATKRAAERLIHARSPAFAILRPGFVWAPSAYGGSALMRALALLPADLPAREAASPFAATDAGDIARTIGFLARRWAGGERDWRVTWDVMERGGESVGGVVSRLRRHMGGPKPWLRLPAALMRLGALAGDAAARLGWSPPIRTTALREMRRGVQGDPGPWISATSIEPRAFADALAHTPASVQERWFAKLYLAKALVIGTLAAFWLVSGLLALTLAFDAAAAILIQAGAPPLLAKAATAATSLLDIAIGGLIAIRRTCRLGLLAGMAVTLAYLLGSVPIAPHLWLDPIGAMVKTVPALVLMLVALLILDER
ncbi:SDR family oxidoreductase [Aureimonas sp. AU20]|uniref:SDR family oxidoreductase n=1 Tax=Aureimonas sp. AU20 TaxID=1349819 RepID=UPI0007212CD1|nr:SDR family oxidoreductase [Aureimonas sp. AU20]ALN71588.1 hypothetical protein M673_02615 [Aureimonas sp. AU20]